MDALVADAHLRNAVAGLRGLGRARIRAFAHDSGRLAAGRWSRFAAGRDTADLAHAALRRGPIVGYPGPEGTIDPLVALPPRLRGRGGLSSPRPQAAPPLRAKR